MKQYQISKNPKRGEKKGILDEKNKVVPNVCVTCLFFVGNGLRVGPWRTTSFFSSKILFFHLSLDFWKFDVFSSNFNFMKMLFIDGAIIQLKFYEFMEISYASPWNIDRTYYFFVSNILLFNLSLNFWKYFILSSNNQQIIIYGSVPSTPPPPWYPPKSFTFLTR